MNFQIIENALRPEQQRNVDCLSSLSPLCNLSFGLPSSNSEEFSLQILRFSAKVNGQRAFTWLKSTRDANNVPEVNGEKPKAQVSIA